MHKQADREIAMESFNDPAIRLESSIRPTRFPACPPTSKVVTVISSWGYMKQWPGRYPSQWTHLVHRSKSLMQVLLPQHQSLMIKSSPPTQPTKWSPLLRAKQSYNGICKDHALYIQSIESVYKVMIGGKCRYSTLMQTKHRKIWKQNYSKSILAKIEGETSKSWNETGSF